MNVQVRQNSTRSAGALRCPGTTRVPLQFRGGRRSCRGFTLAEVLAALLFMAIVIPVAIEGVRVASQAGIVAQRKSIAMRHAERVLNEALVTGQTQTASQTGAVDDEGTRYAWRLQIEPWEQGILQIVTVHVYFPVQGLDYDVALSTLVDTSTQ